jgi:predicted secreted hydrolase
MKRLVVVLLLGACRPRAPAPEPVLKVGQVLSGDDSGFARAIAPRAFSFPADHGPHSAYRSEWWYLTGHLSAGPRRFGYQLTIFRQALAPETPARPSAWATRQAFMGHLAVTDEAGHRFIAFERLARDGLGLAGAEASRVWVEDWSIRPSFPLALQAGQPGQVALALTVGAGRGPILQGEGGLSRKGPEPWNASYYYSCTRLPTSGRLTLAGQDLAVTGESWYDREWSTSALGPELAGWDWLALNLSDGRDLMVYRLRRHDGSAAAESRATIIDPSGATRLYGPGAFRLNADAWWTSPQSGARYPVSVMVEIPAAGLRVETRPLLEDQELRLSFRYWEGAVTATGRAGGADITARGYLELTGYAP